MPSVLLIKRNIENNVYRLEDVRKVFARNKKSLISPAWNTFLAIIDENSEPISTHVCCKYCNKVMKSSVTIANGKDASTSNLLRHVKICKAKVQLVSKKKRKYQCLEYVN
jgi:hypothetical protein